MELVEFLKKFASQLEKKVEEKLAPRYRLSDEYDDFGSMIPPFPIQREAVRALKVCIESGKKAPFLVAEMGSGKTLIATWLAQVLKSRHTLLIVPPHLVTKWKDTIIAAYPDKVVLTIPDDETRDAGISDLVALQEIKRHGVCDFLVMSREAAKRTFPTKPALIKVIAKDEKTGNRERKPACPQCGTPVTEDEMKTIDKRDRICSNKSCGQPLYTYYRESWAKPSLARYIQKSMRRFWDLFIFDEIHQYKSGDSAQGDILGKLGRKAVTLQLTGTLTGGMAADLFYLLFRTDPRDLIREGFTYGSVQKFVEKYGVQEQTTSKDDEELARRGGKKTAKVKIRNKPGISPLVVGNFLLHRAVFLRLADFAEYLPLYNEYPVGCALHPLLQKGYDKLAGTVRDKRKTRATAQHGAAMQALLAWPDAHRDETIWGVTKEGEKVEVCRVPGVELPIGATEKEQKLVEIVTEAKNAGAKTIVYTNQTRKRDILPNIALLLQEHGFKTAVLRASIGTGKRLEWIGERVKDIDVLITHPRLISEGTDMLEFPYLVNFDCGYSAFTLRQAARRSLRLTQTWPWIKVFYFYTKDTIQQDCLSLMARKTEVSLLLEGEVSSAGIESMTGGDDDNIMAQLVKVVTGELKTENVLEVFSRLNKKNNEGKPADRKILCSSKGSAVDVGVIDRREATFSPEMPAFIIAREYTSKGQALLPF